MSIFRTIAMFIYLFGYMIVHYGVLRRAERALAAGDMQLVEELVNKHIPHWSRGILKVTGVSLSVEGLENIPKDTACVFVGNHRSYYDIPLLLASLDKPHGILAKEELEKIPLLNRWMKLLGVFVAFRWLWGWLEDTNFNLDIMNISLWMMIAMCYSSRFRAMTDGELHEWVQSIFRRRSSNPLPSIRIP